MNRRTVVGSMKPGTPVVTTIVLTILLVAIPYFAVTHGQNIGANAGSAAPQAAPQVGVAKSTQNPLQVALLHWYNANLTTSFSAGNSGATAGVAFDGANVWVVNEGDGTVIKLRANDGAKLGTFKVGTLPGYVAFDGANMWVTDQNDQTVMKLRARDGAVLGT